MAFAPPTFFLVHFNLVFYTVIFLPVNCNAVGETTSLCLVVGATTSAKSLQYVGTPGRGKGRRSSGLRGDLFYILQNIPLGIKKRENSEHVMLSVMILFNCNRKKK